MSQRYNIPAGLSVANLGRYERTRYNIPESEEQPAQPSRYPEPVINPQMEPSGLTEFGTPAVEQLRILAGSESGGQGRQWDEYVFPGTLMVTNVRGAKRIVEKEVVNGGAFVTEGINTGRFEFSLTGRLTGRGNLRPVDIINALNYICSLQAPFEVEHPVLFELGIDWMYIEDYDYGMQPGYTNTVDVRIKCRQYRPHLLELKDLDGAPQPNRSDAKSLNTTPVNQ